MAGRGEVMIQIPYTNCFVCGRRFYPWDIHSHTELEYQEYYRKTNENFDYRVIWGVPFTTA